MNFRELNSAISVSPQILPDDLQSIIDAGFKSIICNRPDGEEVGQTDYAVIEAAAHAAGIPICNVPVVSSGITRQNIIDMKSALDTMEKPVFAYCRSGARCTNLYNLVQDMEE